MEEKHLQLKHRIAFGTAMSGFFCITLLIFSPMLLYVKETDDMWFSIRTLMYSVALISVSTFVVMSLLLSLSPGAIHKGLCCVVFGLSFGFFLQCAFLNIKYGSGVLDGSQIIWRDYTAYGAINSAIWAGCIALPFALYMVFKRSWRHALMIAAGVLVIAQAVILTIGIVQNKSSLDKFSHEVTRDGIYELADEENTIVFVVSSMDNAYFKEYKKAHPELEKQLTGFTQYDNALATGADTMVSLPAMLTGEIYKKDVKYTDYINKIWKTENLYDLLQQEGVDVRIFCDDLYFGNGAVRKIDNVVDRVHDSESFKKITDTMYRYTMYNSMPHYLKRFFWMNIRDYSSYKSNNTFTPFNDDKFFSGYIENDGFDVTDKYHRSLRIYHLQGAKEPYRMNAQGIKTLSQTSRQEQTEGEMSYILGMIERLKQQNMYNNARIIITADNGQIDREQNPMLLYKDVNEQNTYRISNAPVSLFDLPATLAATVTDDYSDYGSGVTFKDAEKAPSDRERSFYRNAGSNAASRIEEYLCTGSAESPGSLELVAKHMINGGKVEDYKLGKELTFSADETASTYCNTGFSNANSWRIVMLGKKAVMKIPIEKIPDNADELKAYFNILATYEKTPVVIKANGTEVYNGILNAAVRDNGLNFLIPTDVINGKTLRLEFSFPDIKDDEAEILAMTSFVIDVNKK